MIVHDVEQGSKEWIALRLGKVTASGVGEIVTPATLKPSKSADRYLARLVAETILGTPVDETTSEFMDRGLAMEADAASWYEWERDVEAQVVGCVSRDDGRVLCSPDRLIGETGGLEIKCPSALVHTEYLLDPAKLLAAYKSQVQASLWITGRAWWDLLSFNPFLPPVCLHVLPDPEWVAAVAPAVDAFLARLDAALASVMPKVEARRGENPFI